MRGLMGSFAAMPLQDVVDVLARRKTSGVLTCERGTVRKTLFLKEGVAVGAASNDPREYLGQLLLNFGHITEDQLAKAFRTQEETKVRLGKVLTGAGIVSPEVIRQTLAIKIRETLLDAFVWDSGLFYLDDTALPASDELETAVPLGEIAREAEFRATAWQAFRAQFPTGAATLNIDEFNLPAGAGPDTVDGRLLALARDGKTIDELGLALHATDFHLYQRLYALQRQGVLSAAPVMPLPAEALEPAGGTDLYDEARAHLAAGRFAEAEAIASRAVALAPQNEGAQVLWIQAQRGLEAVLQSELLDPPRTPALAMSQDEVALMHLSSAEKYLLTRCNGVRHVGQIIEVSPLRELDVLKAIKRFVTARIVDLK